MGNSKLESALDLAKRGFKVHPLQDGSKVARVKGWPALATTDEAQIRAWWVQYPNANPAIHCSDMLVIDVDAHKSGDASLELLEITDGELPKTLTTRTPTGGRHLFFRSPNVANGVDTLGPGLDIRSSHGYVVAPGSVVPAGQYRFEEDCQIADAPDWLVALVGRSKPRERTSVERVADAGIHIVERASDWLRTAERSVKGAGGDETAYKVACRLRDMGVSELQAGELMRSDAWDYGCGWRAGWLEEKPIASAYRYATGDPGSKAALPEDFPLLPVQESAVSTERVHDFDMNSERVDETPKKERVAYSLDDFASKPRHSAGYLVKGLLDRGSYAEIYGAPGQGKTFVALDIGFHVAAGKEWMGHRVKQAPVLYVGFEAFGGLANRAKALQTHYGVPGVPMFFAPGDFNLREQSGRQAFGQLLAGLPEKPGLIIFDTFAYALMGGDENSAQDVGAFNQAAQALIASTGATLLIIHHTGKDEKKGARGSSAIKGAVDTEISISDNRIAPLKQREMELCEPVGFKLTGLVIGVDEDGDSITSCVVEPSTAATAAVRQVAKLKKDSVPEMMYAALCMARPQNNPISDVEWRQACEFLPDGKAGLAAFRKARYALKRMKIIVVDDATLMTTRRME